MMCYGNFRENAQQQIELPDDDPVVVAAITQYLYSGQITNFGATDGEDASDSNAAKASNQLAELYIAAEKYQLDDLKALVVQKLERVTDVEASPLEFLTMAQKIYANTAAAENVYRVFFNASAALLPAVNDMSKCLREVFDDCLCQGGYLAIDLTAAMSASYEGRIRLQTTNLHKEQRVVEELTDDNTMAQWKIDGLLIEIADLEKKLEGVTDKYEVALQQKMGLISRIRTLEGGDRMAVSDYEDRHSDNGSGVAECSEE
ncbi:MAG: hypothetical protein Q9207_000856 [Kuettlingeria erythrocarpa]